MGIIRFIEFIAEEQNAGFIRGAGADAARHHDKYIKPHLVRGTDSPLTHTLGKDHGIIPSGTRLRLHKVEDIGGKAHVHVSDQHGNKHVVPVAKLHKPTAKTENRGHEFENHFIEHLKKHGLMDQDAKGAGSTAGTDFHVINKKQNTRHEGKVSSHHNIGAYNGETKQDTTAAMGQLTIKHDPKKGGWHIPEEARAKRPEYAKEIEKAGILHHMNQHHPDPHKTETTASGRAKSVSLPHHNMEPANAYLKDHHVDLLHVGGGYGTYAVGKDKTGHGLPNVSGKGKWTVREKQAGNKTSRTVMFQPHGRSGLNKSHVNLENEDHMAAFKKTLGHQ